MAREIFLFTSALASELIHGLDPRGTVNFCGVKTPVILCHQDSYRIGLGGNHGDVYTWFNQGLDAAEINSPPGVQAMDFAQVGGQLDGLPVHFLEVIWVVQTVLAHLELYPAAVARTLLPGSTTPGLFVPGTGLNSGHFSVGQLANEGVFELKKYGLWEALMAATSVREASDIIMLRYEKPASIYTADREKSLEKRAGFGQEYYEKYEGVDTLLECLVIPVVPILVPAQNCNDFVPVRGVVIRLDIPGRARRKTA